MLTPVSPSAASARTLGLRDRLRVPAWRWGLAASVMGLGFALAWRKLDLKVIRSAADEAISQPLVVVVAIAAYTAAFWLRAVAWQQWMPSRPGLRQLFANLQLSLFLNHVFPLKAGEVSRPYLATRHGVPAGEAISSTIVARLVDFICLALIAVAAIPAVRERGAIGLSVQLATLCIAAGALAVLALRRGAPAFLPAILRARAVVVRDGLREIPLARIAAVLPIVLVSWLLEAVVLASAAVLLDVNLSARVAIGATAFTILFQAVHVTPGGIGVYEAAMTSVLVSQGVPADDALSLAVVTHAMKFAYSLSVAAIFAAAEGVFLLRGTTERGPSRASRFEVVMARLWNVVNEGKPFTPVFTLGVLLLLSIPHITSAEYWLRAAAALVAVTPVALVFFRFDFPLRLRATLWLLLAVFTATTGFVDISALALVVTLYLGFTVVLWGTIYYHLRIGTKWSNGFRFVRLVCENPDPTSGNLLEQLPKVAMLVLAFRWLVAEPGPGSYAFVLAFAAFAGVLALLLHQWFFTWVPALPGRRIATEPLPIPARTSKRVIAIVIDGCRADRLIEANTPFIDSLRNEGTDYVSMNTVYPARTVTCFSSMLTGAPPLVHGMRSNFVPSLGVKCESVFDVLRDSGMTGKLVGIAHLIDAFGHDDVRSVTAVMDNDEIDDALVARGKQVMREANPDLVVLQLLSVDQTGHARGSYNSEYLAKIEETDAKIAQFLGWCRDEGYIDGATVLLTADHGQGIGIGGHGHMSPSETRIPCILWGEGVEAGRVETETRFITDIAPTITGLLGLRAPRDSVGRVLGERPGALSEKPVVFVVPAKNEADNLPAVFARIRASGIPNTRTVVVDDGSTDATVAVARAHGAIVVSHETNRGLGAALRTGLEVARGLDPRAAIYLDADGEYDAAEAARLLEPIESGEADYVLGSRFKGATSGMTRSRRLANALFSGLLSFLTLRRISDGQTGYRAFSPRALDVADIIHDYNYAQVLTMDLVHKGMRLREVPITYTRRTRGRSFVKADYLWRVPLGMMREMLSDQR